jgi:hypothetical protein
LVVGFIWGAPVGKATDQRPESLDFLDAQKKPRKPRKPRMPEKPKKPKTASYNK